MKRQPPTPRSATEHAAHPVRHAVALAKAGPPLARQAPIPHSALGLPHSFTSTHPKTCPAFVIRPFASSQLSTFSAFWPRTTASNPCLSAACKLADGKVRKFHFCPRSSSLYLAIPLGFREEGLGALAFSPRHRSLFLLNRSGDSRETPEPKSLLKVYRFFTIFQKNVTLPSPVLFLQGPQFQTLAKKWHLVVTILKGGGEDRNHQSTNPSLHPSTINHQPSTFLDCLIPRPRLC